MDTRLKTVETTLTPEFRTRPAKWTDLESASQLMYAAWEDDGDITMAPTPEDLRVRWQTSGFDLEHDTVLVETLDGRLVGYNQIENRHAHTTLETEGYVHPHFKGRGIGTLLLRAMEKRALEQISRVEPDVKILLRSPINNRDQSAHELHRKEGYSPIRYYWRMEIHLTAPPEAASFLPGVELRPFVKDEQAQLVLEAENESFRDHWDHHDQSYEQWANRKFSRKEFDPALWMIAWDGDEIAGFSLNRYRGGIGWIGTLGVRRPWRKRGLGEALLLHSFGEFYRRGMKTIGLGVDAQNPTGATRLYQKAGMYPVSEFAYYEKELRQGREIDQKQK